MHPLASEANTPSEGFSRQISSVLFADIAGYTSLMQRDEANALALLKEFKRAIFDCSPEYGGRVVQYYGDGCLMIFETAEQAVRCALVLQVNFRSKPELLPVRMGIHHGEVMVEEEHIYGDCVNVTARIETMALPGSVLVSKAAVDQVPQVEGLTFSLLGAFGFKHIQQPLEVYALNSANLPIPTAEQLSRKGIAYQIDNTPEVNSAVQVLVVEDDMIVGAHISMVLAEAGYGVLGLMPTGEAALAQISASPPDLILMDVNLKGKLDGIETATHIYERFQIPVIFLTANADEVTFNRAKAAFPHAFINKPFQPQALLRAIELVVQRIQDGTAPMHQAGPAAQPPISADHVFVRDKNRMVKIQMADIQYVEAERNYCRIHTSQRAYLLSVPMKTVEERLDKLAFVRTHRSFMVNLSAVESFDESYLYLGEQAIPLSKAFKEPVLQRLNRV